MIAETADIRFECEKCGQHLVVESAAAGLTADCPICNTGVTVPGAGKDQETNRHGHATTAEERVSFADSGAEMLRTELIDASLLNGKLGAEVTKVRDEAIRLQLELKELAEEHERLNATATHAQRELKTFQSERQQLKSEAATLRQRIATADEALLARRAESERLSAELSAAQGRLAASADALAQTRDRLSALNQELAAARTEASESQRQLGAMAQDRDAVKAHLATTQEKLAATERDLDGALGRLATGEAALGEARQAISKLEHERGELQSRLEDAGNRLITAAETAKKLAETESLLHAETERAKAAEAAGRVASERCEQLTREIDGLRQDLKESHTGRELLEIRTQRDGALADRDRLAQRVEAVEADLRKLETTAETLRSERDEALRARDAARAEVEDLRDSQTLKDNEVLRGIVARLNGELAQRNAETVRLRRAQYATKLAYAVFGVGALGLAAFALKVLPHSIHF